MTVLAIQDLTKRFGGLEAVSRLSMNVTPGRITGLIGPNGAGKTTVINLITGIIIPTAGRVLLGDRDITGLASHKVARSGIARTFQNIRLLREASVLDNVVVGFHRQETTSLAANLLGLPSVWRERRHLRQRAAGMLERFNMTRFAHVPAGSLSYGHQRRVELMRAMATSPDFLLLDEPAAGMNDVEADDLGAVMRDVTAAGAGVLLVEHNMRFVMSICQDLYVVDYGRLISTGAPTVVCEDPAVISAYFGT
jgi:branched-chain amino acid transport system ATP-binding protein